MIDILVSYPGRRKGARCEVNTVCIVFWKALGEVYNDYGERYFVQSKVCSLELHMTNVRHMMRPLVRF